MQFEEVRFSVPDYIVFGILILCSTFTGIWFGYLKPKFFEPKPEPEKPPGETKEDPKAPKKKKQRKDFSSHEIAEYLLGSRQLSPFPVAMSLIGSYVSGVTVLGTPSEIYNYGTQYMLITLSLIFMGITVSYIYLPVFHRLRVESSYKYLEMRFSSIIRSFASFMFVMDEIFFLPVILYVPAIAFNQVSGVNYIIAGLVICFVTVFYTLLGGIKAVVHTDAWQIIVMYLSVMVVVILGTIAVGGPQNVFDVAEQGGRLIFFDTKLDLYKRHSFWSVVIGGYIYWTSFNSVNQTMVQRYMLVPTLAVARRSFAIFTVGIQMFLFACCYAGLLIYHYFHNCDPMTAGIITNYDQLFPIYVISTCSKYPGISGLFIAGVFGAALSSLSVVLNSTSLVILEDIIKGCFKLHPKEKISFLIVKGTVIVLGIMACSLVFVIERLGAVLSVCTSLTGIAAGCSFGLFTLGMLVPWANTVGASCGVVVGMIMASWMSFGIQINTATGLVKPHMLPISTVDCPTNVSSEVSYPDESDVFPLYRLSFHWINPFGVINVLIVGTIMSFVTGPTKVSSLNAKLLSPVIHRFLPDECFLSKNLGPGVEESAVDVH